MILLLNLVGNTVFGSDQEILLNSFMEKIEEHIVNVPNIGKNLIKASKVLEITVEDYHQSNNPEVIINNSRMKSQMKITIIGVFLTKILILKTKKSQMAVKIYRKI